MGRFSDATAIWHGGASNPRGVARALVRAIDEAVEQGGGSKAAQDPAVQMIIDHLCFLVGLPQPSLDMGISVWEDGVCRKVSEGVEKEKTAPKQPETATI